MDAQQITGLCISALGAAFFLFRRPFARGVAGYAKNNTPLEVDDGSMKFVEGLYAVFGGICIILGGYVFFA